jgi:hypothetical protein
MSGDWARPIISKKASALRITKGPCADSAHRDLPELASIVVEPTVVAPHETIPKRERPDRTTTPPRITGFSIDIFSSLLRITLHVATYRIPSPKHPLMKQLIILLSLCPTLLSSTTPITLAKGFKKSIIHALNKPYKQILLSKDGSLL